MPRGESLFIESSLELLGEALLLDRTEFEVRIVGADQLTSVSDIEGDLVANYQTATCRCNHDVLE